MSKIILQCSSIVIEKLKLVIDVYDGALNFNTFKAYKLKQAASERFHPEYNLLSDFETVKVEMTLNEISEYAKFAASQGNIVGKRKAAIVIANPHQIVSSQAYDKSVSPLTGQSLQIFKDFDTALDYLELAPHKKEIISEIKKFKRKPSYYFDAEGNEMPKPCCSKVAKIMNKLLK